MFFCFYPLRLADSGSLIYGFGSQEEIKRCYQFKRFFSVMEDKMNRSRNSAPVFVYGLIISAMLLSGCAQAAVVPPTSTPVPLPTNTPVPTDTPMPTITPTPTPIPTNTPSPTFTPTPNLKATQEFEAAQTQDALLAFIDKDLRTIDLSTSQGVLAYFNPDSYSIVNDKYNMIFYDQMDPGNSYKNFVLHTDITWESTSGLAGCGLILRAQDPILERKTLLFGTWRLSGYPAWDLNYWNYGKYVSSLSGWLIRNDAIKQDNSATNEYLLVLKDKMMTAYVNGTKMRSVAIDAVPDAGLWGVFTRQESGQTTCTFNNTWVWSLDSDI